MICVTLGNPVTLVTLSEHGLALQRSSGNSSTSILSHSGDAFLAWLMKPVVTRAVSAASSYYRGQLVPWSTRVLLIVCTSLITFLLIRLGELSPWWFTDRIQEKKRPGWPCSISARLLEEPRRLPPDSFPDSGLLWYPPNIWATSAFHFYCCIRSDSFIHWDSLCSLCSPIVFFHLWRISPWHGQMLPF